MPWKMPAMCDNCPFSDVPERVHLAPGRLDGIKDAAILGRPFHCHKTTYTPSLRKRPRRSWIECAGAIAYREEVWRQADHEAQWRAAWDRMMERPL